jgi:hypothetical protein
VDGTPEKQAILSPASELGASGSPPLLDDVSCCAFRFASSIVSLYINIY